MRMEHGNDETLIARARAIRHTVFVLEQNVAPEEEWDDKDRQAIHFVMVDDGQRDIATGRLIRMEQTAKCQRIAVLREARGRSAGLKLMQAMIEYARQQGMETAKLSSQCHAIPFYEKLGFTAHGGIYEDAGIPHRDMTLQL